MKTQMRVQKILMLVSLVVSALVFVYALIFLTGGLADVYRYISTVDGQDNIHCANFVNTSQNFVSTLVALGIVMIVLVAFMYLMNCHSRRNYYVTNYIAIGLFVVFALVVAIYMVAMVATTMNLYLNDILWNVGEGEEITRAVMNDDGTISFVTSHLNYAEQAEFYPDYPLDPNQTYNFVLGFIMFVVVLADVVCVVLCTVWKFFLMKGEKALLANGAPATEAAIPATETNAAEAVEVIAPVETQTAETEVVSGDNPAKEEE